MMNGYSLFLHSIRIVAMGWPCLQRTLEYRLMRLPRKENSGLINQRILTPIPQRSRETTLVISDAAIAPPTNRLEQ